VTGRAFVWLCLGALVVGVGLDAVTWLLAGSGPEASGGAPWSLRGNGALIVPLGLGPALLVGMWSALVLHGRHSARWREASAIIGLIGLGLVLAGMLALVAFGATYAGQVTANWLFISVFGWLVLGPLVAGFLPVRQRLSGAGGWLAHVVAGIAATLLLVVGFMGAERVLPPGS
jgi:hypothetical protein